MHARTFILLSTIFCAALWGACDILAQTIVEPSGPVFVTPPVEDCSTPAPVFLDPTTDCSTSTPIYIDPAAPMMQPGVPMTAPGMPMEMVPMPQTAIPGPGGMPGPMFGAPGVVYPNGAATVPPPQTAPPSGPLAHIAPGGSISPRFGLPAGPDLTPGPNPIQVPVANDEAAWEQIVDVVHEYFPIASEQQARRSGATWAEGRIQTKYVSGATIFEPFRKNSVGAFNRWESTFQTIRRIATVRVVPDGAGFQVEVVVQKELEDLPRPENATAGAVTFRTTGALPSPRKQDVSRLISSQRWIALGRDPALENRMLADIQARFTQQPDSSWPSFW